MSQPLPYRDFKWIDPEEIILDNYHENSKESGENKTTKGVKKNVIKNEIVHSDYLNVLLNSEKMHHQMRSIRSDRHQISSYHLNKVSLSPFDDKRYIFSDGITSYAYGHKNII